MATVTASAATNSNSMPGMLTKENFSEVLRKNLDLKKQRIWNRDLMGSKFFRDMPMDGENVRIGEFYGVGLVPRSRDIETLPVDETGQGFVKTINAVTYRLAIQIERALLDDDKLGVIGTRQAKLLESANRTVEYMLADAFNRGFGASGAPFTAADGMYLFDSARPNPHPSAGTWSNLETAAALTLNSLWTMDKAFAANKDERGLRAPLNMRGFIVPKALQKKASEIARSAKNPENAMNTANYYEGVVFEVWNYLTSDTAWFGYAGDLQGEDNELYQFWRERPDTLTYGFDSNMPDALGQRVRFRWALGCGRPHILRGNAGA